MEPCVKRRFCLIGFGEVGQILAADLSAVGELSAYDILFPDPLSVPSRALPGSAVRAASNAPDAVADCDVILCAVTAASDLEAARSVGPGLRPGAWYLDLNSASPGTKQAAAEIVEMAGGRYVEAAVMSPFSPKRLASPILLGGPHAEEFQRDFGELFAGATVFSNEIGKASAAKMCRSVMIKGIEALLTESLLAARHYGVEDTVLKSLSDLFPIADWEKLACYMISRSLQHGARRAEEMREVAETVRDAGLAPILSAAAAERHDWAAGHAAALSARDLRTLLDNILEQSGKVKR
jgi:3-hydroxyisobutyrate dehydrogenase-like beta-hydroxyacid dehydrogenase